MMMRVVKWMMAGVLCSLMGGSSCNNGGEDGGSLPQPTRDAGNLGPLGGQCVVECETAADCCVGPQCGTSIFHFNCAAGRCEQVGCTVDNDCNALPAGKCATLGTFGLCGKGCQLPEDCCPPLPPGVVIPAGRDFVTLAFDGGGQATVYRCGVYPQKFICTGSDVTADDAGSTGICLRVCNVDSDCPGILVPTPDGGFTSMRVDGGSIAFPTDAGVARFFQQVCKPQFPGAPFGSCEKGCLTDADCCPDPTGALCHASGLRQLCVGGMCTADGCRNDAECSAGLCLP